MRPSRHASSRRRIDQACRCILPRTQSKRGPAAKRQGPPPVILLSTPTPEGIVRYSRTPVLPEASRSWREHAPRCSKMRKQARKEPSDCKAREQRSRDDGQWPEDVTAIVRMDLNLL
jgi:hypothetical protein